MSDVLTFIVRQANSIAQRGHFLAVGETVEMEEHVARQEFPGRLAYEDGRVVSPWQPPTELEVLVTSLPSRRAHERVDLLAAHRADILLSGLMTEDEHAAAVEAAKTEAEADQARHTKRDEARAAAAESAVAEPVAPPPAPVTVVTPEVSAAPVDDVAADDPSSTRRARRG